jgi:hypothetical protein
MGPEHFRSSLNLSSIYRRLHVRKITSNSGFIQRLDNTYDMCTREVASAQGADIQASRTFTV